MLVIGSLIKIEETYAVVDDQKYKVPSCLNALDLTFKTFFTFGALYPNRRIDSGSLFSTRYMIFQLPVIH